MTATAVSGVNGAGFDGEVSLAKVKAHQLAFLTNFGNSMFALQRISEKELAQQPLNTEETAVFENFVERKLEYTGFRYWTGWHQASFTQTTCCRCRIRRNQLYAMYVIRS